MPEPASRPAPDRAPARRRPATSLATVVTVGAFLALAAAGLAADAPAATAPPPDAKPVGLAPELPPGLIVPDASRPGPGFDVERATDAYLAVLSPQQRARSDAYQEGEHWLTLWSTLWAVLISWILLASGLSRRMRERAERLVRKRWLVPALYAVFWLVAMFVLDLPFSIYAGYVREHQYGLATQTFGPWMGDQLKGLAVGLVLNPFLVAALYAAVRRTGARWWAWATVLAGAAMVFGMIIAPVAIAPLFNDYKPLADGEVRDTVLSLARANRIPATDVYVFDASRQTTRVSANVSGLFHTTRISLNDNLLNRTSLPEIRAVMAHEMGHYVLNHSRRLVLSFTAVLGFAFLFLHLVFDRALARWGGRWGIADRTDPAGLPLVAAILAVFFFVLAPLTNGIVRSAEAEADAFGINAAGEPHGFATVALRLGSYRKLAPSPLEEWWFYDHPSGRDRIERAMTWLAENPDTPRVRAALALADGEAAADAPPLAAPGAVATSATGDATDAPPTP